MPCSCTRVAAGARHRLAGRRGIEGFASVMAGARARHGENDDALLKDMSVVLDSRSAAYPETEGGSP